MKQPPSITISEPFPLLDPGRYIALCVQATFAWARQWQKWMARLVLDPADYKGRAYTGKLCKFLSLGRDRERPFAAPHSDFRKLFVEVNGGQPVSTEASMELFVGLRYEIAVETVTKDRKERQCPPEHWYSIVREIHVEGKWPKHLPTQQPSTPEPSNASTRQLANPEPSNTPTLRTLKDPLTDQQSNTANTPQAVNEENSSSQRLNSARSRS